MISVLYRLGLFISSFFPLYFLLILMNYAYFSKWENIIQIFQFSNPVMSLFWITIFGFIVVSVVSLLFIAKRSQNERHAFKNIHKREESLLSYVVTYVVPLLSIDIADTGSLLMNAGLFLLLGFIYVKHYVVYLNPLFLFIGFDVFRTDQGQVLISNYALYELKNLEGDRLRCRRLAYNVYVVRKP